MSINTMKYYSSIKRSDRSKKDLRLIKEKEMTRTGCDTGTDFINWKGPLLTLGVMGHCKSASGKDHYPAPKVPAPGFQEVWVQLPCPPIPGNPSASVPPPEEPDHAVSIPRLSKAATHQTNAWQPPGAPAPS